MRPHTEEENPWLRRGRALAWCAHFHLANLRSDRTLAGGSGPDVSLTSYGARISTVHLTLESIAAGRLTPRRTQLWLDDADVVREPPAPLKRLRRRGLEIRLTEDLGCHKKYFPYVTEVPLDGPLVTADDDVLYPPHWLQGLSDAHAARPDCVHGYRVHVAGMGESLAPYADWEPCRTVAASHRHFATGVSGVIYPAAMLESLARAGKGFVDCCPRADDIWLKLHALRTNTQVAQVQAHSLRFLNVPLTQRAGLFQTNIASGGNDQALAATLDAAARDVLRSAREPDASTTSVDSPV